eukprot:g44923.t1
MVRSVLVHFEIKKEVVFGLLKSIKVDKSLGLMGTEYKNQDAIVQLCKTLVRPHFKYCVHIWSPCDKKDVETLERVQKRFTRMLPGLEVLWVTKKVDEGSVVAIVYMDFIKAFDK